VVNRMKHMERPFPSTFLDLLTNEEIHRALLRATIIRQGIQDPDGFMENNSFESQVMYRDVRMPDGSTSMMASVAITKVTPKANSTTTTSDPQGKGK
jgi:hypothetical protein